MTISGSRWAAQVITAVCVVLGCGGRDPEPCFELAIGDRLGVQVLQAYTPSSDYTYDAARTMLTGEPSCQSFDSLEGQVLELTVVSQEELDEEHCQSNYATLDAPDTLGQITFGGVEPSSDGNDLVGFPWRPSLKSNKWGTVNGCTGGWSIALEQAGDDSTFFKAPAVGQAPTTLLLRGFAPGDSAECTAQFPDVEKPAGYCADPYVVEVSRL